MGKFLSFLQIDTIPKNYQQLGLKYTAITISSMLTFVIVDTFLILYLLEFLTYGQLGIVIAIQLLVGGLLDYPTGALADKFGHGRILITAYICIIPGGILLYINQTFNGVIFAFILISIGRSQESGALDSYFDNLYKLGAESFDKESKIFGAFKSRVQTLMHFIAGLSFIAGGLIATWFDRRFLILLNVLFAIQTLILVIKLIGFKKPVIEEGELNVFGHVKTGLSFVFSSRPIILFYLGISLVYAANSAIWYSQLLFPYYFGYSGTDFLTGILRAINFILGLSMILLVPKMSKNIVNERFWFIITLSYANPIFFVITYTYFILVAPTQSFVLYPYIGVIGIFFMVGFGDILSNVLLNRIQLEIVPNKIRNSIYSLIPTIVTLSGVPLAIIGGWVIANMGFGEGILLTILISSVGAVIAAIGISGLEVGKYGEKKVEDTDLMIDPKEKI